MSSNTPDESFIANEILESGKFTEDIVNDLNNLWQSKSKSLHNIGMELGEFAPNRCRVGTKNVNEICNDSKDCPYNTSCFGQYQRISGEQQMQINPRCFPDVFFRGGPQGIIDMDHIDNIIENKHDYVRDLVKDAKFIANNLDNVTEYMEPEFPPAEGCPEGKYTSGQLRDWEICMDDNQCGNGSLCLAVITDPSNSFWGDPDEALIYDPRDTSMLPTPVCVPCDNWNDHYAASFPYCINLKQQHQTNV